MSQNYEKKFLVTLHENESRDNRKEKQNTEKKKAEIQ